MASDVRVTVSNWLVVGVMALVFIVVAKIVTAKYPVKGLTEVVQSA